MLTSILIVALATWCCAGAVTCPSPDGIEVVEYNRKQKIFVFFVAGPFVWLCLFMGLVWALVCDAYDWAIIKLGK